MTHPLVTRLTEEFGFPAFEDRAAFDAWSGRPGVQVAFVPGDAARIPDAIAIARDWLAARGHQASEGQTRADDLADASLRRENYEGNRPSETEACRTGDARFFPAEG